MKSYDNLVQVSYQVGINVLPKQIVQSHTKALVLYNVVFKFVKIDKYIY